MAQHQWTERLMHYQFLAELLQERRVLEIGCGAGQGAAFLAGVAREVVAVDTSQVEVNQSRRAFPSPNLEFIAGEPDRLQLDAASFDVILVPELQRWITRGSFTPEVQRLLRPGGMAVFAVPSGDLDGARGMAYQDLAEYLAQGFPHVRIVGQIPFSGAAMADFEPAGEPEPQIDSSLVEEDEPPTHYLAICGDRPVPPLDYTIVQMPAAGSAVSELESLRGKFDRLVEERADVQLELEDTRLKVAEAERRVLEAGVETRHELTSLRREVRERQDRIETLTRELKQTHSALEELRSLQREGDRAVEDVVQELREQLDEQRDRAQTELQQAGQRLEQHVEASQRRIKQLEQELRLVRAEQTQPEGEALRQARERLAQVERELAESREQLAALGERAERAEEPGRGAVSISRGGDDLERRSERERLRADAAEERLQRERERVDHERDRAEEAGRRYLEERVRAETLQARLEAGERALEEARAAVARERQRAEAGERRCDALVIRVEQGAGELSSLHQRIAELQGLRQADQWRVDELTARLREQEQRAGAQRPSDAGSAGFAAELTRAQERIRELEATLAEQVRGEKGARPSEEAERRIVELEQRGAELAVQNQQYGDVVSDLERKLMLAESRVVENSRKATNAESKIVQLEVRLKRSESEAATLSKWAEELREELKAAQGKSTVRPVTPEPEVAALRNDLRDAQARIVELEGRCDRFIKDAERANAALREKEQALEEALRSADGTMLEELHQLRRDGQALQAARTELAQCKRDLAEAERTLRDTEQAGAELQRTRQELEELRRRVRDVDAATEELERLRLESIRHRETRDELERVRAELEEVRIGLVRAEDEMRGGAALPEEAAWGEWSSGEEEEEEEPEYEGYVGAEIEGGPGEAESETGDRAWELEERLRMRERQLEALLDGAGLHREETERLQTQVSEMDALSQELQTERNELEQKLASCEQHLVTQRTTAEELRTELLRVGRELARSQGELKRCQDERSRLTGGAAGAMGPTAAGARPEDLEREVRERQRLQDELTRRLRELDEARAMLREKDRALDLVETEDTAHRAEVRELRRQLRDLEERLAGPGRAARPEWERQLAETRAQMNDLEDRLKAEAKNLSTIEGQLRDLAQATMDR